MTGRQIKAQNSALDAVAPSHGIIKKCEKVGWGNYLSPFVLLIYMNKAHLILIWVCHYVHVLYLVIQGFLWVGVKCAQ